MLTSIVISVAIPAVIILIFFSYYNGLVRRRNDIKLAFSSVDVFLKKRFDLIPNLVATVLEYAKHEASTFAKITELRKKDYSTMSNSEKIQTQNEISKAQISLDAVAENYPELKAAAGFMDLRRYINETEEQISATRRYYNTSVVDYNNAIETIPTLWFAGMFGFTKNNDILVTPENERENVSVKELFNS